MKQRERATSLKQKFDTTQVGKPKEHQSDSTVNTPAFRQGSLEAKGPPLDVQKERRIIKLERQTLPTTMPTFLN